MSEEDATKIMEMPLYKILNELLALRAIVGELAASNLTYCPYCHVVEWKDDGLVHEADCLITRAREAMQ